MGRPIAAAIAVCTLAVGCAHSSSSTATTTTTTTTPPTTETSVTTVVDTSVVATSQPSTATTTVPLESTPQEPLEIAVGEWRLRITSPSPGGTSPPAVGICYELSAPVREPVVALEVTPMRNGAAIGEPITLDAVVGVASATADFAGLDGAVDLQIQLVVDGSPLEGAVLTIAGVTLQPGANPPTCG